MRSEEDLVQMVESRHMVMSTIINQRLSKLRTIHSSWDEAGISESLKVALDSNDVAVFKDMLSLINSKRSITLNTAATLMRMAKEVVAHRYEE